MVRFDVACICSVENATIFYLVWLSVYTETMFSNTENGTFWKTLSKLDKFENALVWTGENGTF